MSPIVINAGRIIPTKKGSIPYPPPPPPPPPPSGSTVFGFVFDDSNGTHGLTYQGLWDYTMSNIGAATKTTLHRLYFTQAQFEANAVVSSAPMQITQAGAPINRAITTKVDPVGLAARTGSVMAKYAATIHTIRLWADANNVIVPLDAWHEPEQEITSGQFSMTTYHAFQQAFIDLVVAEGSKRVQPWVCIENYTVNGGNSFTAHDLIDPLIPHGLVGMNWDVTSFSDANDRYSLPGSTNPYVFEKCAQFCKDNNLKYAVAEWGTGQISTDRSTGTNGAGRANYITQWCNWHRAGSILPCEWMTYFDNGVGNKTGYDSRLDWTNAGAFPDVLSCAAHAAQAAQNGTLRLLP